MIDLEQSNGHEHSAISGVKLSMVMAMMMMVVIITGAKHVCKPNGYIISWA
jgi:hypothetical protein